MIGEKRAGNYSDALDSLLRRIKENENGVSIDEVLTFENDADRWFGPKIDILDLIDRYDKFGLFEVDIKAKRIRYKTKKVQSA